MLCRLGKKRNEKKQAVIAVRERCPRPERKGRSAAWLWISGHYVAGATRDNSS